MLISRRETGTRCDAKYKPEAQHMCCIFFVSYLGVSLDSRRILLNTAAFAVISYKDVQFQLLIIFSRGRLVKDRVTKLPKLNIRNWEAGVIIPIRRVDVENAPNKDKEMVTVEDDSLSIPDWEIFHGTVPVPMQVPAAPYGKKRPWFYSQQR